MSKKTLFEEVLGEERLLHLLGEAAIAAPVERHRAAAMRDDEFQRREILEQVALDELHEGGGVGVDVMRAGVMEVRVAGRGDVDHGRHVELDQLLVDRIPPAVGERRIGPVAAGRIGIEVDADEAELRRGARARGCSSSAARRDAAAAGRRARNCRAAASQMRWMRSFDRRDHTLPVSSVPTWWAMPAARGEKMVRSLPRSFCSLSCGSTLLRSMSSVMPRSFVAGRRIGSASPASCLSRKVEKRLRLGRVMAVDVDDHGRLSRAGSMLTRDRSRSSVSIDQQTHRDCAPSIDNKQGGCARVRPGRGARVAPPIPHGTRSPWNPGGGHDPGRFSR